MNLQYVDGLKAEVMQRLKHLLRGLERGDMVYLICPVANATDEEKAFLGWYKDLLAIWGVRGHYPETDTRQEDETGGYRICVDHTEEIAESRQVHAFWRESSRGSVFDLGVAFGFHRLKGTRIKVINRGEVVKMVADQERNKSYERVLLHLDDLAGEQKP